MIIAEYNEKPVPLPISDEELIQLAQEEDSAFFFFTVHSELLYADINGLDLKKKLPVFMMLQEMNLLAYLFEQFDQRQMAEFQEAYPSLLPMRGGEMINYALAICPEAAGVPGKGLLPQYTGQNLFDLMEYKRFQDRRNQHPAFQLVKFYVPIHTSLHCPDGSERKLTGKEAAAFQQQLSYKIVESGCSRHGFDWESSQFVAQLPVCKQEGLLSERPDVEVRNGELWGVIIAEVTYPLDETEIETLKENLNADILYDRRRFPFDTRVAEGTLHVKFTKCTEVCQQAQGELVLTEPEMFHLQAPHCARHVLNVTGFEPDFSSEWSYQKTNPIWLELSNDRKTIRIPLPTNEGTLLEGKRRIGVKPGMAFDSKLKVPCIGYLNNHRLTAAELQVPVLNQLEEELRNMTQKSRIALEDMCMHIDYVFQLDLRLVNQTLTEARIQERDGEERKQEFFGGMNLGM